MDSVDSGVDRVGVRAFSGGDVRAGVGMRVGLGDEEQRDAGAVDTE